MIFFVHDGLNGLFKFDTTCRMPRHARMAPRNDGLGMRYVVEKIIVLNGVAVVGLAGEIYVLPPKTMATIGRSAGSGGCGRTSRL
ncbi:hypothetical protein N7471_006506 [Penicillium samsonianum]|uniref:uncharacterized protein n=1 Tax=Penicillium samsonianum TaxID=1882272 RepID=UPI0025470028|nr:uncharacterized protein N7471_006506 [Penicillium samsonianum]KAJ6140020.1 hypothetical protein N7471_006506 [Penicillium samsonianum]